MVTNQLLWNTFFRLPDIQVSMCCPSLQMDDGEMCATMIMCLLFVDHHVINSNMYMYGHMFINKACSCIVS